MSHQSHAQQLVRRIGLGAAVVGLTWIVPLHAQQTGRVGGRVLAAETGGGLAGARVSVDGSSLSTTTDESGRYVLLRVPVGSQTLRLSYIGRTPQTQDVVVAAEQTMEANFAIPVAAFCLEDISVLGTRAMVQAEALNRQKNAPNIQNIVAADQIGRFPDASAPEAVQRLPGIAVERDQGEGRYIQIRGGAAANTQVTFNGIQVPSPEGDERQIALDAVPVDILQSIEVSKAILPDMDADAIGGAVNLVTIQAPEARYVSMEASGGFGTIRDDASGRGSLTLGNRFADGRLGLLLTGSYGRRNFGSDDLEPVYDLGEAGFGDDALAELETRHYTLWRRRMGGTATVDYRFGENSTWTLTGIYSELTDVEQRRNTLNIVEDGELAFLHKNRREELEMYSVSLTGQHILPGGLELDYRAAFARSAEFTPYDTEIEFLQEDVSFDPDLSDPDRIQANPAPGSENGDFLFDGVEPASSDTHNQDMVGGVNLAIPYVLGGTATGRLKLGLQYRDKEKVQDVREEAFELADGAAGILLGQDVGSPFAVGGFNPGPYPFSPNSTSPDEVIDFANLFGGSLDGEVDLEAETNDYDLTERVLAGYLMTEINVTPDLLVLPGVRYEHTRVESAGFEFDPDTEVLSPTAGEKDYGTFFPMVHLRYAVGSQTNIRAAYTTTISRPNFFLLVPYRLRDDEDRELGNPELDPTIARSLDLLFEHYDRRIGIISAGVFYKRLTDPIFFFTTDNELGGQDVQPGNGDAGTIRGVEVALQQQLRFLPAPLDGLGLYANYTYTDSEATLPGGRDARLQGQADHVFNTAVSYERGVFSGQMSLNYNDNYVGEYGGDEGTPDEELEDVYIDRHMQLDASASLRTTNRSALFVELVNLTNEPFKAYQGVPERPIQMEYYERWGRLGFRYSW